MPKTRLQNLHKLIRSTTNNQNYCSVLLEIRRRFLVLLGASMVLCFITILLDPSQDDTVKNAHIVNVSLSFFVLSLSALIELSLSVFSV